ncbi:polysaccharide lyase family 7 protein [Pontibacter sp. G13]|uniref:polysaccharide lyase family 7 protein n=1 Tax=Pontibacter sp. G13 TaxID=3074898 RepID=UPI00288AFFCC|nr:polysaccharide lyase family 7 protein [Pontibacter sp. G13]WNJ19702.1 polysaccharide lyase family 7 protein [Pontibacter sp. G13]
MKKTTNWLLCLVSVCAVVLAGCQRTQLSPMGDDKPLTLASTTGGSGTPTPVSLDNPGFENNFTDWSDVDPSAISGDAHTGSKSAKITGSGGEVSQSVSVTANTDYELRAWVLEKGTIGVDLGSSTVEDGGDYSSWTQVSVSFNTGSATSIEIYGKYNGGTGRVDDFELWANSGSGGGGGGGGGGSTTELSVSTVTASADDGNGPANTRDGDLNTRWSANGNGQYITFDLGSSKLVESVDIAWYKGDQRAADFEIWVGTTTNSLVKVYDSNSSGNTLALESYDVTDATGRYVRVIGYGNSANSWNSITELDIYGQDSGSGGGDTTPPGNVSSLSANAGNGQVALSWNNPGDSDFSYVEVSYAGGSQTTTGSSLTITGLTNGTSYTFTAVAYDASGNGSSGQSVNATPSGGGGGGTVYPTDIIPSLVEWKITLPVDANGDDSSNSTSASNRNNDAHEIKDNNLIDYEYPPYFYASNGEVYFRGHCAGATTSGSYYPRSELRQRVGGGDNYWSVDDYQYLQTNLRVTQVPVVKPEVSMVQIHGPSDEPLRVQYHADIGVYIIWNESNKDTGNALDYNLGEDLRVTVTVDNGDITCLIENLDQGTNYSRTWASSDNTGYFKVGCYTQSSIFLSDFKSNYSQDEPLTAYGEVAVSSINLVETY